MKLSIISIQKLLFPLIFNFLCLTFYLNGHTQNASYDLNSVPIIGTNNTAFGFDVLTFNTSGQRNSGLGHKSIFSNSSGSFNVAIGASSLYSNTDGNYNTAVGYRALYNNTGVSNAAFGASALANNTTGHSNFAMGTNSLIGNTTGTYNIGIGYNANVASGNLTNATAIGYGAIVNASNAMQLGNSLVTYIYAGTGSNATIVTGGLQVTGGAPGIGKVLTSDASGVATWQIPSSGGGGGWSLTGNSGTVDGINFIGTTDNVALNIRVNNQKAGRIDANSYPGNTFYGFESGGNIGLGGELNTAIGYQALKSNTSGYQNTALGVIALSNNTIGILNTAIGEGSLYNNTWGSSNVAVGTSALMSNTTGGENVAVGNFAMMGASNTFDNSAFGDFSLSYNISGQGNCAFGSKANVGSASLNNSTAIGFNAIVNSSNKIRFGDATVTVVEGPVGYTVSDARFKDNISETDVKGLAFISRLRPVVYNFNTKKFTEFLTQKMPDSIRNEYLEGKDFSSSTAIRQSGFIAQEVELAAMESGYDFNGLHKPESELDNYSLAYSQFVVPLVKSVQELSQQNQALVQKVNEQQQVNEQLSRELAELKSLVLGRTENLSTAENIRSLELKTTAAEARLFQNTPNPFSKSTTIRYTIPENAGSAKIRVTNMDGALLFEAELISNNGRPVEIPANQLSAGTYIYSLFVDGKVADSKKMVVTR
ncbi:MAG: tail fiber domain-containing protein [Chitinophagaceae bacterium]|nr:tail fiber domain-containing protein [Chitinophagaceae bacterium]